MTLTADFTHVFAVPGQNSIIDAINPETGRSQICGDTLEQVQAREPGAVIMAWEDWRAEQAAKQQTPIAWTEVGADVYNEMLDVLPPIGFSGKGFMVSEPCDHCYTTGRARFQAYRQQGGRYYASTRPLTVAEWKAV